jgi:hypothetical protein
MTSPSLCPRRPSAAFYAQLFQDHPHIEPEIFAVVIEGNRAITEPGGRSCR